MLKNLYLTDNLKLEFLSGGFATGDVVECIRSGFLPVTQAQADAKAAELLDNQLSVVRRVTIKHVWCGARTGDVVALEWPSVGISGNFAIRRQTIAVGSAGCICTSELRRFERG